ncbi:uncharacterized protein NECHADRAFT_55935 [Fusarium vanettenii 77-13-4]|uniref:Transcriptional activator of proteases prtT n=1 Tax=Fusarium vanettenii (strain ATCC MYA-4622 / CBS 123669 / FGSC 9596 / NRRL 45880 / 77-13-4) TaxID=660122 RepID=C7ZQ53_FUSV7|nr:uncharacterized protein NECHADRAFT_55935 [Fusarium vanettenii 77-13-4]EEU33848.1 hypothetical protein NECHADRAFT_55935 [Fusarium vanettenii 77-13-4]
MSTTPTSVDADGVRRKRRNSSPGADERQAQRQRAQRTIIACERCRMKKLRCMGGLPCSACQRAKVECGFGDRERDSQNSISIANQRISQLEKTVAELIATINRETNTLPPRTLVQPSTRLSERPENPGDTQRVSRSSIFRSGLGLAAPNGSLIMTPEASQGSVDPRSSERLESRWSALQHDSAPFPALMGHPAAWLERPVKTNPGGVSPNTVGMTIYKAQVHLQSEPVSEGIVEEVVARALFTLFFQKCHPSFPMLESYEDLGRHFEHIRSSSPFLFTSILAIAGRYYNSYRERLLALERPQAITVNALEALAELACAHLGFVLFRKQHQLSDVQATLLLSVWIPRGKGQSADQWMISGLCNRLAHRIGMTDLWSRPEVQRFINSPNPDVKDTQLVDEILPQWHTWLMLHQ